MAVRWREGRDEEAQPSRGVGVPVGGHAVLGLLVIDSDLLRPDRARLEPCELA